MSANPADVIELAIGRSLDEFLAAAETTTAGAIHDGSPGLFLAREIDLVFREEIWKDGLPIHPLSATLAINAYYSFMGATRVALSGHLVAVFPLARQALECACY